MDCTAQSGKLGSFPRLRTQSYTCPSLHNVPWRRMGEWKYSFRYSIRRHQTKVEQLVSRLGCLITGRRAFATPKVTAWNKPQK